MRLRIAFGQQVARIDQVALKRAERRQLAALLAVPYLLNVLRFSGVTDTDSGRANAGWKTFLWLNYLTGFLVTMLLIWWATVRPV